MGFGLAFRLRDYLFTFSRSEYPACFVGGLSRASRIREREEEKNGLKSILLYCYWPLLNQNVLPKLVNKSSSSMTFLFKYKVTGN